jgi:SAM-dependent methyltransferase
MDWTQQTIKTYDSSAIALAKYFGSIGPRTKDIELGLSLARSGKKTGRVIEIGCGDGRDAVEIIRRVQYYEGFDPSNKLLEIAKTRLPNESFVLADALTYDYPNNTDVIFAFASLLHVNKTDLSQVFKKAVQSLRQDGIFYISLKERKVYTEEVKKDKYGERMFYFYTPSLIKSIADNRLLPVHEDHQIVGNTKWFTIALKKA